MVPMLVRSPSLGRLAGGIRADIQRRWAHYISDFTDGLSPKVMAATMFLYFACLAPAIAFGGLMAQKTGGSIGVMGAVDAAAL